MQADTATTLVHRRLSLLTPAGTMSVVAFYDRRDTMQKVLRSVFILILLGFFTVSSAQLPPEIMADKHLTHAEQLYAAKDYEDAFNVMEKVIALKKEHNLTLSDEFHFKYAQVALAADSTRIAIESVGRYLSATGKDGEFYKEALALMLKAEGNYVMTAEDFYNEVIKTQGTCEGLPKGSSCWMELTNHPECYVWNEKLYEGQTVIWSGTCSDHLPDGKGTLTWYRLREDEENGKQVQRKWLEDTGLFQAGKKQGQWVEAEMTTTGILNRLYKGPYVDGKKHGHWVEKELFGYFGPGGIEKQPHTIEEGPYVDGKRHGYWVTSRHYPEYKTYHEETYSNDEGSYVDGKKHGQWIIHETQYSLRHEVPYVDGKKHGHWVTRMKDGTVYENSYMDGKPHGQLVIRFPDGIVEETTYVDGKWTETVIRFPDGTVGGGLYVNGQKHGKWVDKPHDIYLDNDFYRGFIGEGAYVDGEEQGEWVYRHPNGDILKIEWDNGRPSSTVFWYDYDEEKCWSLRRNTIKKNKKLKKEICLE